MKTEQLLQVDIHFHNWQGLILNTKQLQKLEMIKVIKMILGFKKNPKWNHPVITLELQKNIQFEEATFLPFQCM